MRWNARVVWRAPKFGRRWVPAHGRGMAGKRNKSARTTGVKKSLHSGFGTDWAGRQGGVDGDSGTAKSCGSLALPKKGRLSFCNRGKKTVSESDGWQTQSPITGESRRSKAVKTIAPGSRCPVWKPVAFFLNRTPMVVRRGRGRPWAPGFPCASLSLPAHPPGFSFITRAEKPAARGGGARVFCCLTKSKTDTGWPFKANVSCRHEACPVDLVQGRSALLSEDCPGDRAERKRRVFETDMTAMTNWGKRGGVILISALPVG